MGQQIVFLFIFVLSHEKRQTHNKQIEHGNKKGQPTTEAIFRGIQSGKVLELFEKLQYQYRHSW